MMMNVEVFFSTLAKLISEREKVNIVVKEVRRKDETDTDATSSRSS